MANTELAGCQFGSEISEEDRFSDASWRRDHKLAAGFGYC
jgi:hypothetical protein